ncbi:MAG: hypothetical protein ACKVOU_11365 [Cytophagales bacterium]
METLAQHFVPQWISIFFLLAIPLPFILITLFVRKATINSKNPSIWLYLSGFWVLFVGYIAFASFNGWFDIVSLPPRVLLFTTFPYALLLFGIVLNSNVYKTIVNHVKVEDLVQLHIFRLIGIFFVLLAFHDALPRSFALIAGFGDIITAITSIFVVKAIQNKKPYAKMCTLIWNIFGTVDILFTAIAANVITKISIDTGVMGVDSLAKFPFCIIPAFAPPTILFLHWAIFQKLKKNSI